jgi:hypothetical protein
MEWIRTVVSTISSFVSIPVSVVIIVCMPFTLTSNKTKVFYVSIATFGLAPLIFMQLLDTFTSNALPIISNGMVAFDLQTSSTVACQISQVGEAAGECAATYVTALFALERYVAVRHPFAAHTYTVNRTVACVVAIAAMATAFNCTAFYLFVPSNPLLCLS